MGALSGSTNLTIIGPAGSGSLTGQTLMLTNANNSGYSGTIQPTNANGYYNLVLNSALGTGGKVLANSTATPLRLKVRATRRPSPLRSLSPYV